MQTSADLADIPIPTDVQAVVVGWDIAFNYAKLVAASVCVQRNRYIKMTESEWPVMVASV